MIDRIGAADFSAFHDNYYRVERPVIITNALIQQHPDADALWCSLRSHILKDSASRVRPLWLEANQTAIASITGIPEILVKLFQGQEVSRRRNFVRVWYSRAGHVTPWHYDGNDLHVCNLQLKGRKRWQLASPDTPLPCVPFTNVCLPPDRSLKQKEHYDFRLEEGELLFLPRYWFHRVESLDNVNINVNWVFTSPPQDGRSKTSRREAELRSLRRLVPGLHSETHTTGWTSPIDGKQKVSPRFKHNVPFVTVTRRLLQEVAKLPLFLVATPWLLHRLVVVYAWRRMHGSGRAAGPSVRQKPSHQ